MSQVILSNSQRVEALQSLGYTGREAAFLTVTALHGGYFLRRQFCEFIDKRGGGTTAALIEKLLVRKHATVAVGCNNTKIYHLCSRPFYAAIGEEDNRNRRERPPFAIKNRLIGLDFVLAHPERTFLATEREKSEYFGSLGIEQSALPTKRFTSQKSRTSTDRYFVDKYPVFVTSGGETVSAQVSFCYVDEGVITLSRFGHYLRQYRALFLALGQFHLIYVAATERPFRTSKRAFDNFLDDVKRTANGTETDPLVRRMLEHFAARKQYESRELESFDRARLIQLRNERQEFSGPKYEALYERWTAGGDTEMTGRSGVPDAQQAALRPTFSTYVLHQDYDVFGTPPRASNVA